jgi:hypothetical protein
VRQAEGGHGHRAAREEGRFEPAAEALADDGRVAHCGGGAAPGGGGELRPTKAKKRPTMC